MDMDTEMKRGNPESVLQANTPPDIVPAYAHDYGNYVARYGMGNFQIQVILKMEGKLDFDKLSRAVRLSVDAEPVLGCRFMEHNPPYFKRLENIDPSMFCSMVEADNVEEAVHRFLESPLDMDHDPMVKVGLIRCAKYDTLGIKLNLSKRWINLKGSLPRQLALNTHCLFQVVQEL